MRYILTGLACLILAVAIFWIVKICWQDMKKLLDSMDEQPEEKEKAD